MLKEALVFREPIISPFSDFCLCVEKCTRLTAIEATDTSNYEGDIQYGLYRLRQLLVHMHW